MSEHNTTADVIERALPLSVYGGRMQATHAIINALADAGLVIVPRDASEQMREAAAHCHPYTDWGQPWAVMISAALGEAADA